MCRDTILRLAATGLTLFPLTQCTATQTPNDVEARAAASTALLEAIGIESGVPAVSAAVVRNDSVLWTGNHGYADAARMIPVGPHHRFRLASVSKLYTASALLAVHEQTGLDLDAPARATVPVWSREGRPVVSSRQLAAHTAGINHYETWDTEAYDPSHTYETATEAVPLFAGAALLFDPGTQYSYSSFGYVLLAAIIEGVTGSPFPEALYGLALEPLGLTETGLEWVTRPHPDDVDLFRLEETRPVRIQPESQSAFRGATGMRSTPRDVARFVNAFLGGDLVSPSIVAGSLTPMLLANGAPAGDERYGVGFGWRIGQDWDGRRVAHHAGVTPGTRSIALGYPDEDVAVALLVNASWTSRMETTAELLAAPFLEAAFPGAGGCPVGAWDMEGTVRDEPEQGRLQIHSQGLACVGEFVSEEALANRFGDEPRTFTLVRVGHRGERHVFALAYPWGLARLYVTVTDGASVSGDIVGWPVALASSEGAGLP